MLGTVAWWVFLTLLWPLYKRLVRLWTGQCELLRISTTPGPPALSTSQIESSLKRSKTPALQRLLVDDHVNVEQAVADIMSIKSVRPDVYPKFGPMLTTSLQQICGYRQLVADVEGLRRIRYSSENTEHERLLLQLWTTLKPDTPLESRISQQWTQLGFQGDDPMTDFRGMGLLGLCNLIYFVSNYTQCAQQVLLRSLHPQYGYSFAIVGINITSLACQLLTTGCLKTHFYNVVDARPTIDSFHRVYCYLLLEFDRFWFAEKPRDIMEFNRVKTKFHKRLVQKLKNRSTVLETELMVVS